MRLDPETVSSFPRSGNEFRVTDVFFEFHEQCHAELVLASIKIINNYLPDYCAVRYKSPFGGLCIVRDKKVLIRK